MVPQRTLQTPADPYPGTDDFRIVDVRYIDHLQIVRYYARPKGSPDDSDWQLPEDYALELDIDYRAESGDIQHETWRLVAPKGMYSDLSSIPAFGRWIVSKVGPHLEASMIHDYLYLKWTDERLNQPRFSDWVFADEVLRAGMKPLSDFTWFQRFAVNFAVGVAGWFFFRNKSERLEDQVLRWKPHLDYLPHDPIPPDQQKPPKPPSLWTTLYMTLAALIFIAIAVMGAERLFAWFGWTAWQAAIAPLADIAQAFFALVIGVVGAVLVVALVLYALLRLYIRLTKNI